MKGHKSRIEQEGNIIDNEHFRGKIRDMIRTREFANYFEAYREKSYASPEIKSRMQFFDEFPEGVSYEGFIIFVSDKEGKTFHDLEVEIKDRIPEYFLHSTKGMHTEKRLSDGASVAVQNNYIALSSKGRKLVRGSWFSRWLYFIEFLGREHWLLYTVCASIISLIVGYFIK